jgi:hypothetical protein
MGISSSHGTEKRLPVLEEPPLLMGLLSRAPILEEVPPEGNILFLKANQLYLRRRQARFIKILGNRAFIRSFRVVVGYYDIP